MILQTILQIDRDLNPLLVEALATSHLSLSLSHHHGAAAKAAKAAVVVIKVSSSQKAGAAVFVLSHALLGFLECLFADSTSFTDLEFRFSGFIEIIEMRHLNEKGKFSSEDEQSEEARHHAWVSTTKLR